MTLLRGILDSKGRRAVWERNNSLPPKFEPSQPESIHKPQTGPEGTVYCCGVRFSPAGHALHVKGEHLPTCCAGVIVAENDPWLAEQDARLKAQPNDTRAADAAVRRAEQIELYYQQQRKSTARRVAGTSEWMTD